MSSPETPLPKEVTAVYEVWDKIVVQPDEWLQNLAGQIAFVAGGGLPKIFGHPDSIIWQGLAHELDANGKIEIAGIEFVRSELELLGQFYRFLYDQQGHFLHCIDERLAEGDLNHLSAEVHQECGACAATQTAIASYLDTNDRVENILAKELGLNVDEKQPIYDDMPHHASLTTLIDFHGDDSVADEANRFALKAVGGLAFQVSLPVEQIRAFFDFRQITVQEQTILLQALVKWNVQIARNIIGDHNDLKAWADYAQIIVDQRDVQADPLVAQLLSLIGQVQHGRMLFIN